MCDQKESVVLHRREKKLVVMLAADGRYGSRCVDACTVLLGEKMGCMEMNHSE